VCATVVQKENTKCNSTIDFSKCLSLTVFNRHPVGVAQVFQNGDSLAQLWLRIFQKMCHNVPLKGDDIYPFLTVTLKILTKNFNF
jgi:hypothetical protein